MIEIIFVWMMFFMLGIGFIIFVYLAYFTEIGKSYMKHQAMCSPYHCVCNTSKKDKDIIKKEWVGLSYDEISKMWDKVEDVLTFARAIEQALKEKNT